MEKYQTLLIFIASFAIVAMAANQIGHFLVKIKLPLISGFLLAGMVAGPFILGLIPLEALEDLRFVDEVALAFIAFAAGNEIYLKELRSRLKNIAWYTTTLVATTFGLGGLAVFLLADFIPFMQPLGTTARVAVAVLAGVILIARSPSSAIAIIDELRAKGPYTQTALGVIIIKDVVVIVLFAMSTSLADALLLDVPFDLTFIILLVTELLLAFLAGYVIAQILRFVLAQHIKDIYKTFLILVVGYGAFWATQELRHYTHNHLSFEVFLEPLLICMVAGFWITNYTPYRDEFSKNLYTVASPIYIAFFTLTGASLALDILAQTFVIAIILFLVRTVTLITGGIAGGLLSGDPLKYSKVTWMFYITQAGVALGLAKEVAVEFPDLGSAFATIMIAVIVVNQIVGPPLFKWVVHYVKEAHTRGKHEFDGVRDAIIIGLEGQSLTLARMLMSHGWQVKVASRKENLVKEAEEAIDVEIHLISDLSLQALQSLKADKAEAIVCLLSDEENYQICELIYEHCGTDTLVVRLNDRANFDRFHKLGVLIVDPTTAMVGLLDHFVRSPKATSLLLGMEPDQDIIGIEVRDRFLHGVFLRDLRLPLDTLILSITRKGHMLISHGYTRLELHDWVTIVGSTKSLEKVMLLFDEG